MPRYLYSSLNEKAGEIRLLTLLPATFSEDIRILLHATPFTEDNTPVFEAISYTWGSTENPAAIVVERSSKISVFSRRLWRETLAVTQNLAAALRHLRFEDKPRVLWIDAICVNQQNLEERSQQVRRMGDIYKSADRVVVWLGPESDNSALALKIMDDLSSKVEVDWLMQEIKPATASDVEWADDKTELSYGAVEALAIYHLLSRSWFERLWVRQEIRLASSKAILMCGHDTITWQSFRIAMYCIFVKRVNLYVLGSKYETFRDRVKLIFHLCSSAVFKRFGDLVHEAGRCRCSDPKDRVYALLSMLPSSEKAVEIEPDYSMTTGQVYMETVLRFISHMKNLSILQSCEMQEDRGSSLSMPTWVPDWSVGRTNNPIWAGDASGDSRADSQYLEDGILKVAGVHSATISQVEQFTSTATSSLAEWMEDLKMLRPPGLMHQPYLGGGTLSDAYCSTIVTGEFRNSFSPPAANSPDLQESRDVLHAILEGREVGVAAGNLTEKYLVYVAHYCGGRSFVTTSEGHVGLAPKAARPGDQVVLLLGGYSPMLLRPHGARYQVVGECYVHGLMHCEALLGVLPSRYQTVNKFDEEMGGSFPAFLDLETGLSQCDDPRLDAMGYGPNESRRKWSSRDKPAKYRWPRWLIPKILEHRGVELETFELE